MSTGAAFAIFTNKKLAGFTDFGARLLTYFKELNRDSVQARFDVDGVFNTLHGLTSAVDDTVTITGSSRATDGLGHIMRITNALGGVSALFENANAVDYHVGLRYAEIPISVVVNPRTGLPEYAAFQEEVGESGVPNSVVNNGSTLTFVVDNVTEAGVTNAGRTVRVYKLVPAAGATTEAIAIEDLPVTWNGTNNRITTTGLLGQSSPSTTAADYVVVLLGLTVKRNTDLETSPNHCFIGTVTGNGAGNTPTVFSTTGQRLLKTFDDASQINFTPYSWLSGTSVDAALHNVVDVLGDAGTSNPGAVRIGTNPVAFTKAKPTAFADGAGGIGTVADGTFPTVKDLQTVLVAINAALDRHRGWTKTLGGSRGLGFGTGTTNVLQSEGVGVAAWLGGTWFLQGISGYTVTTGTNLNAGVGPYVLGEASGGEDGLDRTAIVLDANTDPNEVLMGKWQRVSFDQDGSLTGGFRIGGNLILENVKFTPGLVAITDISSGDPHGLSGKQVNIDGATQRDRAGALVIGDQTSNGVYFATLEDSRIESPDDANCDATLYLFHTAGTGVDHPNQKHVCFRNCAFVASGDHPLISDVDSPDPTIADLVFDGCVFRTDDAVGTTSLFMNLAQTTRITFRNCVFHDRSGKGFLLSGAVFDNCRFFVAFGANMPDNRTYFDLENGKIVNCTFSFNDMGTGAFSVMELTNCNVQGLSVSIVPAEDQAGAAKAFFFTDCKVHDFEIDLNDADSGGNPDNDLVAFVDCNVSNVHVLRAPRGRDSSNSNSNVVLVSGGQANNIHIEVGTAAKTNNLNSLLFVNTGICSGIKLEKDSTAPVYSLASVRIEEGSEVTGLRMIGAYAVSTTAPGVRLGGARNKLSHFVYKDEASGISTGNLVRLAGSDCSLMNCTIEGGNRAGAFVGQLIFVAGNRCLVSGCHLEWSPPDNTAGNEAVRIDGNNCNLTNNIIVKDLSVAAAGTTNYLDDNGTGTIDQDNNYSEATL